MDYFDKIKQKISEFDFLGTETLTTGTFLVGKAPHIAPEAWLHNIFPVLHEDEIILLESQLGKNIPLPYRDFLKTKGNGLRLFGGIFNLYGLRNVRGRGIEAVWQPFSLITPNTVERIDGTPENCFFIGGYNWDASKLCIEESTNRIYRTDRDDFKVLNEWINIEDMLLSEFDRIKNLHDPQGKKKDPNQPTIPFIK